MSTAIFKSLQQVITTTTVTLLQHPSTNNNNNAYKHTIRQVQRQRQQPQYEHATLPYNNTSNNDDNKTCMRSYQQRPNQQLTTGTFVKKTMSKTFITSIRHAYL